MTSLVVHTCLYFLVNSKRSCLRCSILTFLIGIFLVCYVASEDSLTCSSLECDSLSESDLEENPNVNSCFEPYQGEPLASTGDSESSDEEQDEDFILPLVLEKRFEKVIPLANW